MQFINPVFLWGLLFLAIPVIIHLFQFRKFKKVYFSNTAFLREIKETSQQSRRLKHLLVLLMRLLAVSFLVFAFAQPVIPTGDQTVVGNRGVSVFIDNSFSMSSMGRDINLLDNARIIARDIINSYGESDEYQIITGDFENRHQRLYSREQALDMLEDIEGSPAVRTLPEVFQRQTHALRNYPSDRRSIYLISDFQKNITFFDGFEDTLSNINLVHLESVQSRNVSVDSVWFSQPVQIANQTGELLAKVTNHDASNPEEVNLELQLGDQRRPAGRISLSPGESLVDTVTFTINRTGWQRATVSITDYPIQFDDDYHISFHVRDNIRVLTIHSGQANRFLSALFRGINYLNEDLMRETNINYSVFSDYSLIILNELDNISSGFASELENFLAAGGNILVFPKAEIGGSIVNNLTARLGMSPPGAWEEGNFRVGTLNLEDPIFAGVFEQIREDLSLPTAKGRYQLPLGGSNPGLPLLSYRDNRAYVAKYRHGAGSVFLSSAPLDENWNDLVSNGEIFVPLLYRAAIAANQLDKPAYVLGMDQLIPVRNVSAERQAEFRITGSRREFVPGAERRGGNLYLNVYDQIREPGFYEVRRAEELYKIAAFNYDRRESEVEAYSTDELSEMAGDHISVISKGTGTTDGRLLSSARLGSELWQWCIVIALLALLLEQILLRFWKIKGSRKT